MRQEEERGTEGWDDVSSYKDFDFYWEMGNH